MAVSSTLNQPTKIPLTLDRIPDFFKTGKDIRFETQVSTYARPDAAPLAFKGAGRYIFNLVLNHKQLVILQPSDKDG
jgi:hypothetical protein